MIVDALHFLPDSINECDLCIVGGGPLGMLLARNLVRSGEKIVILEAGGIEGSDASQDLLLGDDQTGEYHDLIESRHCQLGGTVNIWNTPVDGEKGAKHVPLDAIDFEKRDWIPHSGWPFPKETLDPYYVRAHELCGLGPVEYGANQWPDSENLPYPLDSSQIISKVYQLAGPGPFLKDLRQFVETSENVICVVNAPVSELIGELASRQTRQARVALGNEKSFLFQARRFVLAAGGIENARLLLASASQCARGLGNNHDVVGRYYMDHPAYYFTELIPRDPRLFERSGFYDLRKIRQTTLLGRLALTEETLRRERLLNLSVVLYPKVAGYRSKGIEALRQLRFRLRERKFKQALPHLVPTLLGVGEIMAYSRELRANPILEGAHYWQAAASKGARFATFEPQFYLEQPPDPNNRIILSEKKDAVGRARSATHWTWGKQSLESACRAAEILNQALQKANIGELRTLKSTRVNPSAHHHMGSTRMADDPRFGVTDSNARLHGSDNVYVAGSSLFPTGGYVNPTLTALALCLKLSDFLKSKE